MQKNTKHDMGTTDKVALPNANMEEECNASTSRHGHMGGAGSGRPLGLAQPLLTDLSSSIYYCIRQRQHRSRQISGRAGNNFSRATA
jgi:hypothetical protein